MPRSARGRCRLSLAASSFLAKAIAFEHLARGPVDAKQSSEAEFLSLEVHLAKVGRAESP